MCVLIIRAHDLRSIVGPCFLGNAHMETVVRLTWEERPRRLTTAHEGLLFPSDHSQISTESLALLDLAEASPKQRFRARDRGWSQRKSEAWGCRKLSALSCR